MLASHGTIGALEAEKEAFSLCADGALIHHLIVVPDFWKGMIGKDFLNDPSSVNGFGNYVESELESEIRKQTEKLAKAANRKKMRYDYQVVVGKPAEIMIKTAFSGKFDLAVIGSPRPKGSKGLRSRMDLDTIARNLKIPILIIPYPAAS